jgi:hypothetical protein
MAGQNDSIGLGHLVFPETISEKLESFHNNHRFRFSLKFNQEGSIVSG